MKPLKEYWIGDKVRLLRSGRIGIFEGIINDRARIRISSKIVLTSASNIELYQEPETIFPDKEISKPKLVDINFPSRPNPTLDLHIERLNPSLQNGNPERILDYQIRAARHLLKSAIKYNYPSVEIIHGKGKGVLKSEIMHLLSLLDEVQNQIFTRGGGAVFVNFKMV